MRYFQWTHAGVTSSDEDIWVHTIESQVLFGAKAYQQRSSWLQDRTVKALGKLSSALARLTKFAGRVFSQPGLNVASVRNRTISESLPTLTPTIHYSPVLHTCASLTHSQAPRLSCFDRAYFLNWIKVQRTLWLRFLWVPVSPLSTWVRESSFKSKESHTPCIPLGPW